LTYTIPFFFGNFSTATHTNDFESGTGVKITLNLHVFALLIGLRTQAMNCNLKSIQIAFVKGSSLPRSATNQSKEGDERWTFPHAMLLTNQSPWLKRPILP